MHREENNLKLRLQPSSDRVSKQRVRQDRSNQNIDEIIHDPVDRSDIHLSLRLSDGNLRCGPDEIEFRLLIS